MKRILSISGIVVLCIVLLSACGGCVHLDRNADGLCDKCSTELSSGTTSGGTTTTRRIDPSSLPAAADVAAAVEAALSKAYLGATFDIGLTAETAPYYHIEGEDGFAILNEDGLLEFVGIRTLTAPFTLLAPDGVTVYSGFYSIGQAPLAVAIRDALFSEGKLAYVGADVPASVLTELSALSLKGVAVTGEELFALRYLSGLQTLSLAGHALGDLSYIHGLPALCDLDISAAKGLLLDDGGLAVVAHLRSLSKLTRVDINGSFSVLNRTVLDTLLSMAAGGSLSLAVLPGLTLNDPSAIGFGETVFFSFDEYLAHYNLHNGIVTPASGFGHAIFVYSDAEHDKDSPIVADNLSMLELYGKEGYYYRSPVTTQNDLSVRLYSYSLRAPRVHDTDGIRAAGALSVTAAGGASSIYGAGWDSGETSTLNPGNGIYTAKSLDLFSENGATLYVEGGRGAAGAAGVTDNNDPDDLKFTTKNGDNGGAGAAAIYAVDAVTFHTESIKAQGGKGGRGGNGATGGDDWGLILSGAFDGGHGGRGGDGGAAIGCRTVNYADGAITLNVSAQLYGGSGGSGGAGGEGYAAGKAGVAGDPGDPSGDFSYH